MTIYFINNTHVYNDITNELKNIKTGKIIKIAAMRVKCLEYMLNHTQQEIIYKKQLTNALWGERSQFISDANLTQILYLLRRDLKDFGLSHFFSTVPRIGIKVEADISVSNETKKNRPTFIRAHYKYTVLFLALLSTITMMIYLTR